VHIYVTVHLKERQNTLQNIHEKKTVFLVSIKYCHKFRLFNSTLINRGFGRTQEVPLKDSKNSEGTEQHTKTPNHT